jgi:uncharacterized membrane protein YheB (UPF0754 family)
LISFSPLIFYILPPLVGALIGYVTNKIAITMLFRPYRQKRFLGLKLPFTPGIIPRQRYELSRSIARQVSAELFTVETINAQLRTPGFLTGLELAVGKGIGALAEKRIAEIAVPGDDGSAAGRLTSLLRESAGRSEALHQLGTALVRTFVRALIGSMPGDDGNPDAGGPAGELTAGFLKRLIDRRQRLGDILTPRVRETLITAMAGILPALREILIEWLNRPSTQTELHRRGILLMRDAVNSLSGLQRLVVIAAQYDRTMEEKMSYLVDRVIIGLEESIMADETSDALLKAADEYLQKSSERTLDELLSPRRIEKLAELTDSLFSGVDPFRDLAAVRAADVIALLPEGLTLGGLLRWDEELAGEAVPLISELLCDLTAKAVPTALEMMDIEILVTNRIDSLEIERVESLLLAVIQKHLKWINFFGALLGALIGGLQVLLQLLRS